MRHSSPIKGSPLLTRLRTTLNVPVQVAAPGIQVNRPEAAGGNRDLKEMV